MPAEYFPVAVYRALIGCLPDRINRLFPVAANAMHVPDYPALPPKNGCRAPVQSRYTMSGSGQPASLVLRVVNRVCAAVCLLADRPAVATIERGVSAKIHRVTGVHVDP